MKYIRYITGFFGEIELFLIITFCFLWKVNFFQMLFKLQNNGTGNKDFLEIAILFGAFLIGICTYIYSVKIQKSNFTNENKPVLELYDFNGNKIPRNHSETSTLSYLEFCGNNNCKDLHLLNLRLFSGSSCLFDPICYRLSDKLTKEKRQLNKGTTLLNIGNEIQLRDGIIDFPEIYTKTKSISVENNCQIILYVSYITYFNYHYKSIYKIVVHEIDFTKDNNIGRFTSCTEITRCLQELTRIEILQSLRNKVLKIIFKRDLDDTEWLIDF